MKPRLLALAFGFCLIAGTAYAGPLPGGTDTDGDTVENAFDNCLSIANATQTDTDHNGCGNSCTPAAPICDTSGDTVIGAADLAQVGMNFGMSGFPPNTNGDCTGDGVVGAADLAGVGMNFGMSIGPSGITTLQCNPATCLCTPQ